MDIRLPSAADCEELGLLLDDAELPGDLYVDADTLISPTGKRLQRKRVLLRRFESACPRWQSKPLDSSLDEAYALERLWQTSPDDRQQEYARRCFRSYRELGLVGVLLWDGQRAAGYSMSAFCGQTGGYILLLRALPSPAGVSAVLHRETALLLRQRQPELRWINLGWVGGEQEHKNRLSYQPFTAAQFEEQKRGERLAP